MKERGIWIPDEWQTDKRLSPTDLILLGKVYGFTKSKGYCWAKDKQLLPIGNMSQSTFDRSKKRLIDLGIFEIENRKSKFRRIKVSLSKLAISTTTTPPTKMLPQPDDDTLPF